jgi:uroporphyrinogen III methyltransferase / synthase
MTKPTKEKKADPDGKNKGPLVGLRVLVTRAQGEAAENLSSLLKEAGATTLEIPVIHFGEPESFDDLDQALENLESYDWVIFASTNAVSSVMARAQKASVVFKSFPSVKIAAIGQSTAEKLSSFGVPTDFVPSSFVAESFVAEFPAKDKKELASTKILWPRTNIGRTLIADALRAKGATVGTVEAYTTCLPPDASVVGQELIAKLKKGEIDVITLASAQTVKNLTEILSIGLGAISAAETELTPAQRLSSLQTLLTGVKVATIGPVTSNAARQNLKDPDIQASVFTAEGLVEEMKKFFVPL